MPQRVCRGLSLVECMVSLSLTMGLLLSLIHLFLIETQIDNSTQQRIQTEQEFFQAYYLLATEVQQAGFVYCQSFSNLESGPALSVNADTPKIHNLRKIAAKESDILNFQSVMPQRFIGTTPTLDQTLNPSLSLTAQDWVILSNCQRLKKFQTPVNTVLTTLPFQEEFIHHSSTVAIGILKNSSFYVADTKRVDRQGNIIKALYREDIHGLNEEMVDGITQLKAHYLPQEKTLHITLEIAHKKTYSFDLYARNLQ